jgi:hypothetical protein
VYASAVDSLRTLREHNNTAGGTLQDDRIELTARGRRTKHDSPRDIPRGCLREDIVVSRNRASGGGEDHAAFSTVAGVNVSDGARSERHPTPYI